MVVLALVLFVVMFLVVFVARSLIQRRRTGDSGIRAGVLAATPGSIEWLAGWLLLLATIAAPAAPVAELLGLDPLTHATWLRWTGVVVAAVGTVLVFVCQLDMGSDWRIGIDSEERTGLVTDGSFSVVRNPIFSALIVCAFGLALIVPNPISIVGAALLVIAVELQVRHVEEPHLRRLHGDAYSSYATHVGRFVPGVGRSTTP